MDAVGHGRALDVHPAPGAGPDDEPLEEREARSALGPGAGGLLERVEGLRAGSNGVFDGPVVQAQACANDDPIAGSGGWAKLFTVSASRLNGNGHARSVAHHPRVRENAWIRGAANDLTGPLKAASIDGRAGFVHRPRASSGRGRYP
jgi:hypothetical protein